MGLARDAGIGAVGVVRSSHFGAAVFAEGMRRYLAALRAAPARPGEAVMAPGDREWRVEAERARDGIPLDPDTAAFLGLAR